MDYGKRSRRFMNLAKKVQDSFSEMKKVVYIFYFLT